MPDTVPLYVRITPEQHAKLQQVAQQKDRSVAWVIRSLIDRLEAK